MSRLSYTYKFTLSIKMKDFKKIAIPLVSGKELHQIIKRELYLTASGIVDGDKTFDDWSYPFYKNLLADGHIKLTDYGKGFIG